MSSPSVDFRAVSELLLALGRALHEAGLPSHKLEVALGRVAERLNTPLQIFSLPTGLLLSFPQDHDPKTFALRVQPGVVNLERLEMLTDITRQIIDGKIPPKDACEHIARIARTPPRWTRSAIVVGYLLSAAAFAVFFGGGWIELAVAVCVGLSVGLIAVTLQPRIRGSNRMFELFAAAASALVSGIADNCLGEFSEWVPLAAGLIILLPGISLVDAIEELANGHLASGGARLAGAGVTFLAIAFGGVLGNEMASLFPGPAPVAHPLTLPDWAIVPALVLVAIGSTIRFRAQPRDVVAILIASTVALLGSRLGANYIGPLEGPFLGALCLGLASFVYTRIAGQVGEIFLVPGLAVLVPGSLGLRSIESLRDQQTLVGIEAAFEMFLIAMSLVAGLMLSNWLVREGSAD